MKTYIADIIPKIQRYSQRLDDLTKLTNQHWVSLGDISHNKRVFIFRINNQLLISENGLVEKGAWEYLGNQSLLIETKQENYLLKHGFFDENIIALKLDGTESYAFFVNETKYHNELNSIEDILKFLEDKYVKGSIDLNGLGQWKNHSINGEDQYNFEIISQTEKWHTILEDYIEYLIKFDNGLSGNIYRGCTTGRYFDMNFWGIKYFDSFEQAIHKLYLKLKKNC